MKTILLNTAAAAALVLGLSAAHAQYAPASGGATTDTPAAAGSGSTGGSSTGAGSAPAAAPNGAAGAGASAACPPGAANCSGAASASGAAGTPANTTPDGAPKAERAAGEAPKDGAKPDQRAADKQGDKQGEMKDGRAAAQKELSTEQRTVIRERVVSRADRVNVNFNVSIGTAIPQSVHVSVQPLPTEIIEIYPDYRGYSYIVLADGRIVIIEPASYEIVTIISI